MDKTTLYLDSENYRRLKRVAFRRRVTARSGRGDLGERAEALLAGLGESR